MFNTYFENALLEAEKLNYNYLGINRKDYPKWEGWKIIAEHRENGLDISEIQCEKLEILVQNFYYLKYIKERY